MYRSIDTMPSMSAPALLALVLAAAIPAALVRAHRLDDRFVDRWMRERGLTGGRETVVRYLRQVRVARTWGGVAGALVPSVVELVWHGRVTVLGFGTDGRSAPLAFGAIFAGYLAGVLWAELAFARPASGRASLAPREPAQYLPRYALLAQRALGLAAAAGALAAGLYGVAAGVLALAAGLEAIERWLVRRPQPFTDAALVAADDAIRAESIRAVAGAGLALLLLAGCAVALVLGAPAVAGVALVAALFACRDIGDGAWRVRRGPAGSLRATPPPPPPPTSSRPRRAPPRCPAGAPPPGARPP